MGEAHQMSSSVLIKPGVGEAPMLARTDIIVSMKTRPELSTIPACAASQMTAAG